MRRFGEDMGEDDRNMKGGGEPFTELISLHTLALPVEGEPSREVPRHGSIQIPRRLNREYQQRCRCRSMMT